MTDGSSPRVLLVSQWPRLKNAEYELIERIRHTGFPVEVVDFLGFDVSGARCLNDAGLPDRFDFAVSFHYETPKFLNLPTFLWIANPLEFMYSQGHYRTHLLQHMQAYDDYLYNGSDVLKEQARRVVGSSWKDSGLAFYGSCSRRAMIAPRGEAPGGAHAGRIFYCGVNWEALVDRAGRAQGLLERLQAAGTADFYGPRTLLGRSTWDGFSSYRGEVPFDGASIFRVMSEYGAVLAVSSPAHLKSRTSSGRVIEGFAAGVPVISDENPHVRMQFGDLAYYFGGDTEQARAEGAMGALDEIRTRPREAVERVRAAQALISQDYCFESCLEAIAAKVRAARPAASRPARPVPPSVDVFVLDHDPYAADAARAEPFRNLAHIDAAARTLALACQVLVHVRVVGPAANTVTVPAASPHPGVQWAFQAARTSPGDWRRMRLGAKLEELASSSGADTAFFLTQWDFPQHDHFVEAVRALPQDGDAAAVHLGGFFVHDLSTPAPESSTGILRNSSSESLYRYSQDSLAEQLGQFAFNRAALRRLDFQRLVPFDVALALAVVMECRASGAAVHRSRHITLRVPQGHYHRYQERFARAAGAGYWAQHYDLVSNAAHELNAMYDAYHEHAEVVATLDRVTGHDLRGQRPDPAVHNVNALIERLRPAWRAWLAVRRFVARPLRGRA
jgi:hypothetical protein